MHPNVFLRTFWRAEFKPQVFVAMSFDDRYKDRFTEIITPAIKLLKINKTTLQPHRVDLSKTGDSILTDIIEGVAHSQLILADVSSVGKDSVTGQAYRNGNVLYEVGLALACRHSSEVLLVRDDHDKFLFDVSTIPHMTLDFSDKDQALTLLSTALSERLKEQNYIRDARVKLAAARLSTVEVSVLKSLLFLSAGLAWSPRPSTIADMIRLADVTRLLDKQLIELTGLLASGQASYQLTPLGRAVAQAVSALPVFDRVATQSDSKP